MIAIARGNFLHWNANQSQTNVIKFCANFFCASTVVIHLACFFTLYFTIGTLLLRNADFDLIREMAHLASSLVLSATFLVFICGRRGQIENGKSVMDDPRSVIVFTISIAVSFVLVLLGSTEDLEMLRTIINDFSVRLSTVLFFGTMYGLYFAFLQVDYEDDKKRMTFAN